MLQPAVDAPQRHAAAEHEQVGPGEVARVADQAEFTPRNVQSADGRATTVYAVKITVPNPSLRLKPGMPADIDFGR